MCQAEVKKVMSDILPYMICATPRSGSTLLCEALRHTGFAGNPDEYFGPMHVARWQEKWQAHSEREYLEKVMQEGLGNNGVWGVKVMRLYWRNLIAQLQSVNGGLHKSEIELLNMRFPGLRFIWITRRNKVRQAISWMKFVQGMAWIWEDDKPQVITGLKFQPAVITEFITQTAIHEAAWLSFFQQSDVQPYIVVYEDFVNAYEETAREILDYLGISYPCPLVFCQRRMQKQADVMTEQWVQKYLDLHVANEQMSYQKFTKD